MLECLTPGYRWEPVHYDRDLFVETPALSVATTTRPDLRRDRLTGWLVVFGLLIGLAVFSAMTDAGHSKQAGSPPATLSLIANYWAHPAQRLVLQDASSRIRPRDPVFYLNRSGEYQFAGFVRSIQRNAVVEKTDKTKEVNVQWCLPAAAPESLSWKLYENRGSFSDALQLLLPADKRARIEQKIRDAMQEHASDLADQLLPILDKSLRQSLPVIEAGVRKSVAKHRTELDALGKKWNDSVVRERLVPLTTERMLPIVRKHGEPVAREVGEDLWQRASVWRFGWRMFYDKSPLPQKDLTSQEWDRFVNEEAIPVFEAHADDIAAAVRMSIAEIANDQEVRQELAAAADVIASDPKSKRMLRIILYDSLVDNQELHRVWRDAWTAPEAIAALEAVGNRIEPVVREIGDELLGTPQSGIEPGFARLLRNQILRKDQRWLVAQSSNRGNPSIQVADQPMPFPLPAFTGAGLAEQAESEAAEAERRD